MLDFFDFFLIGYVLAFIVHDWNLTYGQSAMILLAAGVGVVPGAYFWGWIADKICRRKAFIGTALNFSIATGIDGVHTRSGLDLPDYIPLLCWLRRFRPVHGEYDAGPGVRPHQKWIDLARRAIDALYQRLSRVIVLRGWA